MFSRVVYVTLFVELSVYTVTEQSNKYYKVSMVASEKDPGQPAQFDHAENPVWDSLRNSLLFVDIWKQDIHQLDYTSGKIVTKHIEYGPVNVITTVANSQRMLVAVRASLYLLNWESDGDSGLRPLTSVDLGMPDNVISEGKADANGRFWIGTRGPQKDERLSPDGGSLYSVSQLDLASPRVHVRPVGIGNGLAWALNNSVLYFTDSTTQKVEAFDFDLEKGTLGNRRTIIDVTTYGYNDAIPNGMTIDANGNLWVALMYGGTVLHIDPDARHVIYGYKLPVTRTTSVAWGGPKLDELFVTTSRLGVVQEQEPLAGAIFTIRDTGSAGLPHYQFLFDDADSY